MENRPKSLEQEFHVSRYIIIYKFILGVIELILGLILLIFGNKIFNLYYNFRDEDLLENSQDTLADLAGKLLPYILEYKSFIIIVLILIGLAKIIGSVGLYYKKHWGLDILIVLTFLFLPFDLIELFKHVTLVKFIYLILNIFIALYLVNFQPHTYFNNLKKRMKH